MGPGAKEIYLPGGVFSPLDSIIASKGSMEPHSPVIPSE
jgi:hypothetical protein